jgi:prevent-host-death family protein
VAGARHLKDVHGPSEVCSDVRQGVRVWGLENAHNTGKNMPVKTISVPIGEARSDLCKLVQDVASGNVRVLLTSHGRPKAQIVPCAQRGAPWRVQQPDDPARYGDLQSPIMEDWR